MLFSVEQTFVGRDEKRAPLKTPAWEATTNRAKVFSRASLRKAIVGIERIRETLISKPTPN